MLAKHPKLTQKICSALCIALLWATLLPLFTVHGSVHGSVAHAAQGPEGAVYTLSNSPAGNGVLVFTRAEDGSLTPAGSFPTGGFGSGSGLGSQGAVIVSDDHQLLFAVNAGSNSITSFRISDPQTLVLVNTVPSGGNRPTSVTYRHGLLYVLNAISIPGMPNNISGFTVANDGTLTPLADSTRPLSSEAAAPAQVNFDDLGSTIIVTERATNRIDTYAVGADGLLTGPTVNASAGPTPFGFAVDKRNTILVSEAGPGGGASSYRMGANGSLNAVSAMIMSGQRAACWSVITKNGRYGYVTNAGTSNISGFALNQDGAASLLNADGVTATTMGGPSDAAVSHNSQFLYARIGSQATIAIFAINSDGSLTALPVLTGLPAGVAGLAAW